jgi:hypothetical protein
MPSAQLACGLTPRGWDGCAADAAWEAAVRGAEGAVEAPPQAKSSALAQRTAAAAMRPGVIADLGE